MRDLKIKKSAEFGKRPGAEASQTTSGGREAGPSLSERMGRFFRGFLTGKVVPKIDAKRKKGPRG